MNSRRKFLDDHYCPKRHLPELERCIDFSQVAKIALDVIHGMRVKYPGEVFHQVCGPITTGPGTVDDKLGRFERAIKLLRSRQKVVFNQLPTEVALGRLWHEWQAKQERKSDDYCWELLHEVYQPIFESGFIDCLVFMPNWYQSTGTKWEHSEAKRLGISIAYLPDDWEKYLP